MQRIGIPLLLGLLIQLIPGDMLAADKKADEAHMQPQDMPPDLRVIDNISYKAVGGQQLWLALFAPLKKTDGPTPLVVYIHGGGWTGGNRYKMIRPQIANVVRDLNKHGITCASIEYRLAKPGVSGIAESVADCKDALRFLAKNAARFGIDPERIALFGESAGGHMVLTTGLGDEKDYPCDRSIPGSPVKVLCIVAYYPRVSFSDPSLLVTERYDQDKIGKWMAQIFGDSWKSDPSLLHKLSPVELVRPDSPPMMVVHGDKDQILPVSNATAMRDAALAKGVALDCTIVKGADHCFDGKEIQPSDADIEKSTVDFLLKHLTSAERAGSSIPSPENIIYQYSVKGTYSVPKFDTPPDIPVGNLFQPQTSTAYLWIPPGCAKVRGILVLGDNVPDQGLAGHPEIRRACTEENLAIVFTTPSFRLGGVNAADNRILDDAGKAGHNIRFIRQMLDGLAERSGYGEIATAPWLPIGESMSLQIVTQLTQFAPERAIAGIWVQDDPCNQSIAAVPMLGIQGTGADWEFQNFDLFERWRRMATDAVLRNVAKRQSFPGWPGSQLVEPGSAHFSCTEKVIGLIARYIRLACGARLSGDGSPTLRPVDLSAGWVAGLPVPGCQPMKPKPYAECTPGERDHPWYFDRDFAQAAYDLADVDWNAKTRVPVFLDEVGKIIPFNARGITDLKPLLGEDGITFVVRAGYLDKVPSDFKFHAGESLGAGTGTPVVEWLKGPVIPLGDNRFQLALDRGYAGGDAMAFVRAVSPADQTYHLGIRPAHVKIPLNVAGKPQTITFDPIPDQPATAMEIPLRAVSDAGLPVRFFVKSGPAVIRGDKLFPTPVPTRGKTPVEITVVAWQWGRSATPQVRTAPMVERVFRITPGT